MSFILCCQSNCSLQSICGEDLLRREGFDFLESLVSTLGKDGPVSFNGPLAFQMLVPNQVDLAGPSSSKLFLSILQQLSSTACHHWCHVGKVHICRRTHVDQSRSGELVNGANFPRSQQPRSPSTSADPNSHMRPAGYQRHSSIWMRGRHPRFHCS